MDICLGMGWPSGVWWGSQRLFVGNEAWRAAFEAKSPVRLSHLDEQVDAVFASGKPAMVDEVAADAPGGQAGFEASRWTVSLSALREDGRIAGVFAVALLRDTRLESHADAEALQGRRRSDRYSRALIASLPGSAAFVVDRSFRFVLAEGEALQGAGLRPADLVGKTIREAFPRESAMAREALYASALAGQPFEVEHFEFGRHYLSRGAPLRNENGEIDSVLAVSFDISDRKRAEEALREADRHKNEFLVTLAHELRNPLAPIRSALDALALNADVAPATRRLHAIVKRQVDHMVRLVDDLLELSRISRGTIELRRAPVRLADVVAMALEASRPVIDASHHVLELDLAAGSVWIDADAQRLAQVFANLLNNAARYTPASGRLSLKATVEAGAVRVSVGDNGVGLAPDMRLRVFDLFTQVVPGQGGLGVGLSLVRDIVGLHGGSVEARSAGLGQGSEFVVDLPITVAPVLAPAMQAGPDEGATGDVATCEAVPQPPQRVLVVDDNRDAADSLVLLLQSVGIDAMGASGGADALRAIDDAPFEVVLMDLGMPGMDGFETLRRLRAEPRHDCVRAIALTGWGQAEDRRRSHAAGFEAHVTKPVDLSTLLAALAAVPEPASFDPPAADRGLVPVARSPAG